MEVAVDIIKCAVRDMDVDIQRWAGMHHDYTSDRALAMGPADYHDVVVHRHTLGVATGHRGQDHRAQPFGQSSVA